MLYGCIGSESYGSIKPVDSLPFLLFLKCLLPVAAIFNMLFPNGNLEMMHANLLLSWLHLVYSSFKTSKEGIRRILENSSARSKL